MQNKARFLVVDDEQEVCNFFSYLLKNKGYEVETANTGKEAFFKISSFQFNAALIDLKLPDSDGITILKEIKKTQPECEVIIITGYSTVKSAVEAIQLGAFDYVEKPFVDIDEMERLLEKALNIRAEWESIDQYQKKYGFVVGKNTKMLRLVAAAKKIATKNITVLIQGETGTGKEVLARYIHAVSHRSKLPFWAFNCGAFTENLLESELFGHEKGSFTGAISRKKGIFELAHKGTLFLDEINSASPAIQIKLLRVLENGEFLRVGGEELCKVDVRILSATNADLQAEVKKQNFREDLFYRLDVASLKIPPLRERLEDIPLFINFFLEKETTGKGIKPKKISPEAMNILSSYPWPGNIRELANTVAQMVLLSSGSTITPADLPTKMREKKLLHDPNVMESSTLIPFTEDWKVELPGQLFKKDKKDAAAEIKDDFKDLFPHHPRQGGLLQLLREFKSIIANNLEIKKGFDFYDFQNDLRKCENIILKEIISKTLETTYHNQVEAAKLLGITPRALRYYLKEKNPR